MPYKINSLLTIRYFIWSVLFSCIKVVHGMQNVIDMTPNFFIDEQGIAHINRNRKVIVKLPQIKTGIKTLGRARSFSPLTLSQAGAILTKLSSGLRSEIATYLLGSKRSIIPATLLSAEERAQAEQEKAADAQHIVGYKRPLPDAQTKLTLSGAQERDMLANMNFHDLMIHKHLFRLIPAIVDGQIVEELRKSLKKLYDISEQPEQFLIRADHVADDACIAAEFVRGKQHWTKEGEPLIAGTPYDIEDESFIIEKYGNGTIKVKVGDAYLRLIQSLSPEQINFLIDLYYLSQYCNPQLVEKNALPDNRKQPIFLSAKQAEFFLSLPLDVKENVLNNYAIAISLEFVIHNKSREFIPVLRRTRSYDTPLSPTDLKTEAADYSQSLTKDEIEYLSKLTFEQVELLRDLYIKRGLSVEISRRRAQAFVSLPKDIQERIKDNYPLVSIGYIAWTQGMAQKHPKKTLALATFATAGAGATYHFGSKKVLAACATIVSHAATPAFKKALIKKACWTAGSIAVTVAGERIKDHIQKRYQ